jgi:ketosteroid isomerase-like protein
LGILLAAMSQENLEIIRRGLDAFNRRDVNSFSELATDDFVWLPALPGAVEGGSYEGRSGIRRYFAESQSTWEQLTVLCDEVRDLDESVLVIGRALGRGLGSGIEVETPLAFIAEFRAERISKVSTYLSHADALRAAGLTE